MATKYECSQYLFHKINPYKFSQFDFYDLDNRDEARLYMEKGIIIRVGQTYYTYIGERTYLANDGHRSDLVFKHGNQVFDTIPYL